MIPDEKIQEFRDELLSSSRPIFFFDDDCDGLASFLLLYRAVGEGKGVPIKAAPVLNEQFVSFVMNYSPGKIFVLDNSRITDEFIHEVKSGILCLDHHPYEPMERVKVYNPRDYDPEISWPTSYWAYKIAQREEDIWLAMAGCVGDWFLPDFKDRFIELYPDLLSRDITKPDDALFDSEIGKLSQMLYFVLKGSTKTVLSSMKTLTRIKSPYEILKQESPAGRFIYKHYEKVRRQYDILLKQAKESVSDDRIVVFTYEAATTSMTAEVSNELIHMHPDKIIVVARRKNGEFRCSLRSAGDTLVAPALERALKAVEGYGGGHEHACGASIKEHDFGHFIELLREEFP
ncbi:MAG: DHH family phosphoesterase [Nanoarchaeota archaeon]